MYTDTPEIALEPAVSFHSFTIILLPLLWCESSFSAIFYHRSLSSCSEFGSVFTGRQNKVDELSQFARAVVLVQINKNRPKTLTVSRVMTPGSSYSPRAVLTTGLVKGSQERFCIQRHILELSPWCS